MLYSKEFFKIQLQFARAISKKRKLSYHHAIYQYTCIYVRLLGYSDINRPHIDNPQWKNIIDALPKQQQKQIDYLYQKYIDFESLSKEKSNMKNFGCFSYSYHKELNQYELHFGARDPKGNLGSDRIEARMHDWTQLFQSIYDEGRQNTTTKISTWLLGIEAFSRLLPKEFIAQAKPLYRDHAQNFTYWGPLLDRFGRVKSKMKKELIYRLKTENYEYVEDYFPRRALTSEVKTEIFYDFYLHSKK